MGLPGRLSLKLRLSARPLLLMLIGASLCLSMEDEELNFFVIGDFGGFGLPPYYSPWQKTNAEFMAEAAETINAKFVLALGDNFYNDGVDSVESIRFNRTFEAVYDADSLQIPWYLVAGNHDHRDSVEAQILYSQVSPRWNFPALYYKIQKEIPDGGTVDILMFDRTTLCQTSAILDELDEPLPWGKKEQLEAEDQWQWLEENMRDSTADYLLVASHYPVWSPGDHGPTACLVERLRPMLHQYKVSVYLSGHDHIQAHMKVTEQDHEVHYAITGVANIVNPVGGHEEDIPEGSLQFYWNRLLGMAGHIQVLTTKEKMTYIFYEGNGEEQHQFTVFPRNM